MTTKSPKPLEFGSLGPGRGAPFAVPLLLGILAVTAREIAAATGLRRGGRAIGDERAAPGGMAREVRQDASAATPLD